MKKSPELISTIKGIHGTNLVFSDKSDNWVLSDYSIYYWGSGTEKPQSVNFAINSHGQGVFSSDGAEYVIPPGKLSLKDNKLGIEKFGRGNLEGSFPPQNFELSHYHVLPSGTLSLASYNYRPPQHGNDSVDSESEHRLYLLENETGAIKQELLTKNAIEKTSAIHVSKTHLFSGSQQINVWKLNGDKVEAHFEMNYRSKINHMLHIPDENRLFASRADGTLEVYDSKTWKLLHSGKVFDETPAFITKHPSNNHVLIGGEKGNAVEVSFENDKLETHRSFDLESRLKTGSFHPDGKLLFVSTVHDLLIFSWQH